MGPGGAEGLLGDVDQLRDLAVEEVGDLPVVVFGHSMGSLVAIGYIERSGIGLAGCILSGNGGIAEGLADLATMVRQVADGGMADEAMDALSPFNAAVRAGPHALRLAEPRSSGGRRVHRRSRLR